MKRSVMPIMALVFAFATFVTAVTPASACWWEGRRLGLALRPVTKGQRRKTLCLASLGFRFL